MLPAWRRRPHAEADGARISRGARAIRGCVHDRGLIAAVNLQLRFSPGMLALRDLLTRGVLGTLVDIDVRIVIDQPWHLWPFLEARRGWRFRITRSTTSTRFGRSPASPTASTAARVAHPELPRLRDTRSSIILDYGDRIRCSLVLNHTHRAGPTHRASQLMVEGTTGAARLTWGVNLVVSRRSARHDGGLSDEAMASRAAARVVVHRSVRRTDVEPAAFRRRRGSRAGRLRSTTRSGRWRWWKRATSRASAAATPIPEWT